MYSAHGINDFIICLGYKGYIIKEYFNNYFLHTSDVTFDVAKNLMEVHQQGAEPWRVTLIDTGDDTMTGGRLKRVAAYLSPTEDFCFTYGDGVADVDIGELVSFHQSHGALATITAAQPPGRFGALNIEGDKVVSFQEKPEGDGGWINAGFFVLSPKTLSYLDGDDTVWERAPLERLAREGNLTVFLHDGFWLPMDTLRDKSQLEELWRSGRAPWKVWK
jgi:glucose-1-phosphate cytidylyltransferase